MSILSRSLRLCKYSSIEYIEAYKKYGYDIMIGYVLFYSPKLSELRIYHLTWSHCREKEGFPTCVRFESAKSAAAFIKKNYEEDYL